MAGDAQFLMELALFKDFSSAELAHMSTILEEIHLEPGQLLFKEGAWAASMYLVFSGSIEIFKVIGEKEIPLTLLQPGASLGEMALVRDMYRTGSARAKVDARLLLLKKDKLEKLTGTAPVVAARLYKNIAAILADRVDALNRDVQRAKETVEAEHNKGLFERFFGG